MGWSNLPRGIFTGIDWSDPSQAAGADPYLIWAEATGFAGCGGRPLWLPVLIELQDGTTVKQLVKKSSADWLFVPPAYQNAPEAFRFCTARVKRGFFDAMARGTLRGMVRRLELGLPLVSDADDPTGGSADRALPAPKNARQAVQVPPPARNRKVMAFIDDGFALAHANFLQAGQPRVAHFWRQDNLGLGQVPRELGYGHELGAADIAAAMADHTYDGLVDEGAVYTALGLSQMGQPWPGGRVPFHALDTAVSHGTHVMDLGAGPRTLQAQLANLPPGFDAPPSWAPAADDAASCPIVAVQLDYETVKDTSGGSMSVHVLDALMYVLARCAASEQIVVNISFGTLAGPHDGTSTLEAAMDELLRLWAGRLEIVLAAGNSYQGRTHGNLTLEPGTSQVLNWRVQPDDTTQSFLELWLPAGAEGVQVQVTPPGGRPALPPLSWGESRVWLGGGRQPLGALLYPGRVATGTNGTCALLALAPTFAFASSAVAPSGVWQVVLANTGNTRVTLDAYVERDDVVIATRTGARQSNLEDDPDLAWSQQYDMQAFVDSAKRNTPIRRSGTFNSIATGTRTLPVGARRVSDDTWAHYSPQRPDPDDARPERPGVVKMPREAGYGDENPALPGVPGAGTRSGGIVRIAGTSAAAPQVARARLDAGGGAATSAPAASS
jgi:hypothetical protein